MSLALIVYLISVIPNFGQMCFAFMGFLTVVFAFLFFSGLFDDDWEPLQKYYKKLAIVMFICGTFATLIPSERTMYVMLAAYGVQQVATNEKTQQILGSGVDILNLQLQKYKDELLKEKSK